MLDFKEQNLIRIEHLFKKYYNELDYQLDFSKFCNKYANELESGVLITASCVLEFFSNRLYESLKNLEINKFLTLSKSGIEDNLRIDVEPTELFKILRKIRSNDDKNYNTLFFYSALDYVLRTNSYLPDCNRYYCCDQKVKEFLLNQYDRGQKSLFDFIFSELDEDLSKRSIENFELLAKRIGSLVSITCYDLKNILLNNDAYLNTLYEVEKKNAYLLYDNINCHINVFDKIYQRMHKDKIQDDKYKISKIEDAFIAKKLDFVVTERLFKNLCFANDDIECFEEVKNAEILLAVRQKNDSLSL